MDTNGLEDDGTKSYFRSIFKEVDCSNYQLPYKRIKTVNFKRQMKGAYSMQTLCVPCITHILTQSDS